MLSRVGWKYRQRTLIQFALVSTKTKHSTPRPLHTSTTHQNPAAAAQQCHLTKTAPAHENHVYTRERNTPGQGPRRGDPDQPLPSSLIELASKTLASHVNLDVLSLQIRSSQLLSALFSDREKVRVLAEALAKSPFPSRSLKALSVAHHMGCTPKINAYDGVAHWLAKAREWSELRRVVSLARRHRGRASVRLLNGHIRALLKCKAYHLLDRALNMFAEQHLSPNRLTFHMLICGHICNHDLMSAKRAMQAMEEAGFPIEASTSAAITTVYRSMGFHPEVENTALTTLTKVSSSVATTVLNSLIQLRLDVQDGLGAAQLASRFDHRAVAEIIRVVSGESIIPEAGTSSCFTPNDTTFSLFIDYIGKQKDLRGVHDIVSSMPRAGIPMTPQVLSSLISAYSSVGDVSTPLRIVQKMCHVPEQHWKALAVDVQQPLHLPFHLELIELDVRVFNSLLRAVLSQREIADAVPIIKIMSQARISPDHSTIEILLTYLDKRKGLDARDLLETLSKLVPRDAIRSNIQHLHVVLRALIRQERFLIHGAGWDKSAAKHSRTRFYEAQVPQSTMAVGDPFDPTAGLGAPESASSVRPLLVPWVRSLHVRGVRSGSATIALRLRRDAVNKGDLESARQVLDTLIARGIAPNAYHFSALMEGHTLAGDMNGALDLFDKAQRCGVRPNVVLYTILVSGYARLGQPQNALKTFQKMVKSGIKPDVPAIDAVASAFFIKGYYIMAKRVLLHLWSRIGTPPEDAETARLEDLVRRFRSLHQPNLGRSEEKDLTMQERLQLLRKVDKLLDVWSRRRRRRV